MRLFDKMSSKDLERRERQLTLFACLAVGIMAIGMAVLMYPVVFSPQPQLLQRTLRIAFFGFCILSLLLAGYLWERQSMIRHLRQEIAENRRKAAEEQALASEGLLKTMPQLNSFQDQIPMEYRRTVATSHRLSVLVIIVKASDHTPTSMIATTALGDAAKAISRRLRQQDSVYLLGPTCFGAVLPGADIANAQKIADRVAEGLDDAAGVGKRFTYQVRVINYPAHASSAHELQKAVRALIPYSAPEGTFVPEPLH